jgi:hypothetical protein
MILIFRPWLTRLVVIVVQLLSFGLIRLDQPKLGRLRRLGRFRRWRLSLESRYRGRRDGKLGIPRADEKHAPPGIWKLKQQGDGVVRDLAADWSATDARLNGEREAIERAIDAADAKIRRLEPTIKELRGRCEVRRQRYVDEKTREEGRHPEERWRIPRWFYVLAITIIFLGEFPLNAVAFNLFGEARIQTWVMTAGLAAVLVFCAHSLGILWRQRAMSDRDMIVTVLLTLLPVAVVVAIAVVRENYLEALNENDSGLAVLSPAAGIAIFITMNLVIYLGAFALSYLHHDPEGEMIERLGREVRRAEAAIRTSEREVGRVRALRAWLTTKVALWIGAREEAHRRSAYEGRRHKDFFETFMDEYWASNRLATERALRRTVARARRRGQEIAEDTLAWTAPHALDKPPQIALPEEFDEDFVEQLLEAARDGHRAEPLESETTSEPAAPRRRRGPSRQGA